jgi:hypothetical protein
MTFALPLARWHEDFGDQLWWSFPITESPYCGSPLCNDWPGYHTHYTPIVIPTCAVMDVTSNTVPAFGEGDETQVR